MVPEIPSSSHGTVPCHKPIQALRVLRFCKSRTHGYPFQYRVPGGDQGEPRTSLCCGYGIPQARPAGGLRSGEEAYESRTTSLLAGVTCGRYGRIHGWLAISTQKEAASSRSVPDIATVASPISLIAAAASSALSS